MTLVDGYDVQVARFDARREIDENPDEFATYETAWESLVEPGKGSDEFKMFLAAHREFATAIAEGRAPAIDGVSGTQQRGTRERDLPLVVGRHIGATSARARVVRPGFRGAGLGP